MKWRYDERLQNGGDGLAGEVYRELAQQRAARTIQETMQGTRVRTSAADHCTQLQIAGEAPAYNPARPIVPQQQQMPEMGM